MKNLINYEKALVNAGDDSRIVNVMQRALNGEKLTLAFLGGSITQGCLASTPQGCYAALTYKWWQEAFPEAEFTYINAGIGGTTSHLGTGRVEEEVLSYKPDFVIVEFSVNDDDNSEHFKETYEGLLRRILKADWAPALLLVHNVRYDDGGNAEAIHLPVGKHYNLPSVSMKSTIYEQVAAGKIANRDITSDDLHPNDAGHELVAEVITYYLKQVREKAEELKKASPDAIVKRMKATELPAPITANGYESAHRYRNDELEVVSCNGFVKDETPQSCVADCFKKGFTASRLGDKIVFMVEGESIGVQFKRTMKGPVPVAKITVDGEHSMILDGNFDEDWDCLALATVVEHGKSGRHLVEVEITEAHENDREAFYLVSLVTA
ncbi:MAG: SGNH/GDSL hydrolase family protein [Lachnospiraceae bacterium]